MDQQHSGNHYFYTIHWYTCAAAYDWVIDWLGVLQVKLLVVGTHADLLDKVTIRRICGEVDTLIKQHFSAFKENIKNKVQNWRFTGDISLLHIFESAYYHHLWAT